MGRERKEKQNTDGKGERGGGETETDEEREGRRDTETVKREGRRDTETYGEDREGEKVNYKTKRREELSNFQDSLHYTNLLIEIPSFKIFCERNDIFSERSLLCALISVIRFFLSV